MKHGHEIDDAVENITDLIQKAARLATPHLKRQQNSIIFPTTSEQKIKEKRSSRKLWLRMRYPSYKKRLS